MQLCSEEAAGSGSMYLRSPQWSLRAGKMAQGHQALRRPTRSHQSLAALSAAWPTTLGAQKKVSEETGARLAAAGCCSLRPLQVRSVLRC